MDPRVKPEGDNGGVAPVGAITADSVQTNIAPWP